MRFYLVPLVPSYNGAANETFHHQRLPALLTTPVGRPARSRHNANTPKCRQTRLLASFDAGTASHGRRRHAVAPPGGHDGHLPQFAISVRVRSFRLCSQMMVGGPLVSSVTATHHTTRGHALGNTPTGNARPARRTSTAIAWQHSLVDGLFDSFGLC